MTATARLSFDQAKAILPDNPETPAIPDNIQWMPPGRHSISCFVNGEPTEVEMDVTPAFAVTCNGQLQGMRQRAKAGNGDWPYIDFNHEDRESAGEVTELHWGGNDAKLGGIRAKVKWTGAGLAALQGKNYRRFSPQWALDKKTGKPIGLDGVNVGGLVNKAAFQTIQSVVAKQADETVEQRVTRLVDASLAPLHERLDRAQAQLNQNIEYHNGIVARGVSAAPKSETGIVAQARALAAEKNISLAQAYGALAHSNPKLYRDYVQSFRKSDALPLDDEHPFLVEVRACQARENIGYDKAVAIAASRRPDLADTYRKSVHAQKGITRTVSNSGCPEIRFLARAREYARDNGVTVAQGIDAFVRTEEGSALYQGWRQNMMLASAGKAPASNISRRASAEEIAAASPDSIQHPFAQAVGDLIEAHKPEMLPPMTAAKIIARRDPSLYRDYHDSFETRNYDLGRPDEIEAVQ